MKGMQAEGRFSDITPSMRLAVDGWPILIEESFSYFLSQDLYESMGDKDRRAFAGGVVVPAGFKTDLASVPRLFTRIFPPYGRYSMAAIVHDYLYSSYCKYDCTRQGADRIFLDAMIDRGVSVFTRQCLYRAVRVGGWAPWNRQRGSLNDE